MRHAAFGEFVTKISSEFMSPRMTTLGVGWTDEKGDFSMNAMQMINGAFNIQNWWEREELRKLWKYMQEDEIYIAKFKEL